MIIKMFNAARGYIRSEGRSFIPWVLAAALVGLAGHRADASPPANVGSTVESFSLPEAAEGTQYYVIAVDPDGRASLVQIATVALPPEEFPNAETTSPTPILPAPTGTWPAPTATQVTPALPTVTLAPVPNCSGYPCDSPADQIFRVVRAVTLRSGSALFAPALRVRDTDERVYVQCIREVIKGRSRWASEMPCDSNVMTWTAILHNGLVYMEPFNKE